MRVLVLGSTYPPHALGGYELSCADVMDRWQRKGHEVEVLTTDLRVPGVQDEPQPDVHRTLRWYWEDHRLLTPSWRECVQLERHDQQQLEAALARSPDVVSVWSMGAMPLQLVTTLLQSGIPVVLVVCDDWLWYGPHIDPWTRRYVDRPRLASLVRRLTGLATQLPEALTATTVFVSERTRVLAEERTPWSFPDAAVIASGISLVDFPLVQPATKEWAGSLLCVGRLDPRKGFPTAVRALRLLTGMSLEIVGHADPAHRRELEALAAGLPVTFRAVPRAELREVYRSADVLLFTSAWDEPFGLVPLEAMASGTPVVAVASGGAADYLVHEHNCLVVPAADEGALAEAVTRLSSHPDLRARLVSGGLETAGRYGVDRCADALERVHLEAAR